MRRSSSVLIIGLSTMLLAGCAATGGAATGGGGGGGGGGGPTLPDWSGPLSRYAADAGTAFDALDNSETLHAYNEIMSSALREDHLDNTLEYAGNPEFSIRKEANGDIVAILDGGDPITFTAGDKNQWGYDNGQYSIFSQSGDVDDVLDASNASYNQVWRYWWTPPGLGASTVGYAVVGTETTQGAIATRANVDPTATYSGQADAMIGRAEDRDTLSSLWGDLEMSANFGTAKIFGTIDELNYEPTVGGGGSIAITGGEIQLIETDISTTNGFLGNVSANQIVIDVFGGDASAGDVLGAYGGKFFGPDAGEVAGVFAIDSDDVVASGAFSATEQ